MENVVRISKCLVWLIALLLLADLAGCSKVTVRSIDFTQQKGVYIVGFSKNLANRIEFEEQLALNLKKNNFKVFVSHKDFPDVVAAKPDAVIDVANNRKTLVVLMITPVNRKGQLTLPLAAPIQHPDLYAFYDYQKNEAPGVDPKGQVVAEVHAFLLNHNNTPLYWSGVIAPFKSDNIDSTIEAVAKDLSDALIKARAQVLDID